jgi:hypothetical protein
MVSTRALDLLFFTAGASAFVAVPFLLVNWVTFVRQRSRAALPASRALVPFPIKSVAFFVTPILVAFGAASVAATMERRSALAFLEQSPGRLHVSVNGRPVPNGDDVVLSLKRITPYWAHHSHPTTRIRVEVRDNSARNLVVELGRDSDVPREYWVFSPASAITLRNDIGRVTTSVFDSY